MRSPLEALRLALLSLAVGVAFAEAYQLAAPAMPAAPAWAVAAAVHTVLALGVAAVLWRRGRGGLFSLAAPVRATHAGGTDGGDHAGGAGGGIGGGIDGAVSALRAWLTACTWRMYMPALAVLAGSALLTMLSRMAGGSPSPPGAAMMPIAWVLWVPPVEEIVFRAGVGQGFRRLASPLWAGWFAALTFAFVHGDPTVAHLIAGRIGLPLGPFLLGLCCEALVEATGRLAPAIAFHGACNATVAIFALADGRWLDWLGFLYS